MFGDGGDNPIDQVVDFIVGDRDASPFSTWVHYAQCASIVVLGSVLLFGGCKTGG